MRQIQTISGNAGYRSQLDRVRRFLDRVEGPYANDVEFQDMMWAFFQNCWHLKDWVAADPLVPREIKKAIIARAEESVLLRVCKEMCDGTKHLGKDRNRSTARHKQVAGIVDAHGNIDWDCELDNGVGKLVSGRLLAHQCISEWEAILTFHGLATTRLS